MSRASLRSWRLVKIRMLWCGDGLLHLGFDGVEIRAVGDVDRQVRRRLVGQILQQNRAVDDDVALLASVVVEDIDHAERHVRLAQRQRDRVPVAHVMLVGEGLADDDVVALVHLGVHLPARAAGDKLGPAKLMDAFGIGGS